MEWEIKGRTNVFLQLNLSFSWDVWDFSSWVDASLNSYGKSWEAPVESMFVSAIRNVLEMRNHLFYFSSGIVCFNIYTFEQTLLSGKYFFYKRWTEKEINKMTFKRSIEPSDGWTCSAGRFGNVLIGLWNNDTQPQKNEINCSNPLIWPECMLTWQGPLAVMCIMTPLPGSKDKCCLKLPNCRDQDQITQYQHSKSLALQTWK